MMISDIEIEIHSEYMKKYEQWKSNRYVSCVRTEGGKRSCWKKKYQSQKENKIMRCDIRIRYREEGKKRAGQVKVEEYCPKEV